MRQYLTANDKKNEIKMLLNHPSFSEKVILVVEGQTDIRLFRSLIKHENISIDSFNGKKDLCNLLSEMSTELPDKVIGICDADHDHITNKANIRKTYSLFVTDFHDAEILMLSSPAITCFIDEYSNHTNLTNLKSDLLNNALNCAYEIGLLRLANERHKLKIRFKGLNYSDFININQSSFNLDINSLVDALLLRSTNKKNGTTKESLINLMEQYRSQSICKYQLSNGHDVTNIIALMYRTPWASIQTDLNAAKVESSLRLAYQKAYFYQTELFSNLSSKFLSLGINYS